MEPSWAPSWNLHGNLDATFMGTVMDPSWEPPWNLHGIFMGTFMEPSWETFVDSTNFPMKHSVALPRDMLQQLPSWHFRGTLMETFMASS